MSNTCKWGFLSTAEIGKKNWMAIRLAENAALAGVASRDKAKAQAFIDECQGYCSHPTAPAAFGSYEELLASPEIDAVYIPLPTGLRKQWVIKAAEAGKHVLVEKPVGVTADDVVDMIEACEKNNVQLMDGVMFMHSTRMPELKAAIHDKDKVGDLRRITTCFSFCGPDEFFEGNIRLSHDLEPMGCLGDLGWYTSRLVLYALDWELPNLVKATMLSSAKRSDSDQEVPTEISAELFFANGISASTYNSFRTEHQQIARFCGSKGFVGIEDFVLPFYGGELGFDVVNNEFHVDGCDFDMEHHSERRVVKERPNNHASAQETNMIRTFSELVLSGKPDRSWGQMSLATQIVLDSILEAAITGQPVEPDNRLMGL